MTRRPLIVIKLKPRRTLETAKPCLPRERVDAMPKGKIDPIAFARYWLGDRLQELPEGFYLDGQAVKLDPMMREANRIARSNGKDMVTVNERWITA